MLTLPISTRMVGNGRTSLHELAGSFADRLAVEKVDITVPEQVTPLRERLAGTRFGLLCVNAGITNGNVDITEVPTETFIEVMVTNALSPSSTTWTKPFPGSGHARPVTVPDSIGG